MAPLLSRLIEQPQVNFFAEFIDRTVAPKLFAPCDDRFDGVVADILYRGQPEADGVAMRREVSVAHVDVRRFDGDAHLAALVDVLNHVVGASRHRGEQRSHELYRIARLQIRGVVGQKCIRGRVRLVEAVAGKLGHEVEDLLDFLRRIAALYRAFDETLALLCHLLVLLLAHGAAQQVGFAEGVTCQAVGDLHHLFLVDDDAQSLLQYFLQLGQFVLDLFAAMLAIDEIVNHATLDRAGTVERVQRGKVFDRIRLVAAQDVAHASRFKLEHAGCEPLMEDLFVGLVIVQQDALENDAFAAGLRDQLQRVVENGERGQAQEVHLQQAQLLDRHHVESGDDFVVLGLVQRHQFVERPRRDDYTGRVNPGVAHHAFQFLRSVE
jgi:hypothetical protein